MNRAHKSNLISDVLSFDIGQKMAKTFRTYRCTRKNAHRGNAFFADIKQGLRDHLDEASMSYDNDEDASNENRDASDEDSFLDSLSSKEPYRNEVTLKAPAKVFCKGCISPAEIQETKEVTGKYVDKSLARKISDEEAMTTRYDTEEEEGSSKSSDTFDSFYDQFSEEFQEVSTTTDKFPPPAYIPDPSMIEEGNFHAWCVDTSGNVVDFPDDMLKHGKYQTDEIVRRAWDARLVAFHLPELERQSLEFWKDPFHRSLSKVEVEKMAWKNILPLYFKYERAKAIRNSNPEKYALVVGSLGYRQSDGSVFYEFG